MVYFLLFGIILGNKIIDKELNIQKLILLYGISLPVQKLEGFGWLLLGESNCGTQLKLSSLLTSTLFLLIAYSFLCDTMIEKEGVTQNKLLILIVDCSFGIYLAHILLISVVGKISNYIEIPYMTNFLVILLIGLVCVLTGRKLCDDKVGRWIGLR